MNYRIISADNTPSFAPSGEGRGMFFTTDRTVGRDPELLCPIVGVSPDVFFRPHQVHKDHIIYINKENSSHFTFHSSLPAEGDALITDVRDVCFGISTADCIPVLVYDPEHHAAAAIHAGWRGTAQRIVEKSVKKMQETFGTRPEQCEAVIGPGISMDSFEVGDEVYEAFIDAGFALNSDETSVPITAKRYPARKGNSNSSLFTLHSSLPECWKWHLNLKEINRQQLLAAGLAATNIEVSPIDTFTDEQFFSARREQKDPQHKCGRILSGFVL